VFDNAMMNGGDGRRQETLEAPETKGEVALGAGPSSARQGAARVKAGDCGSTANARGSDKLDDKPGITDPEPARVIDPWAGLPAAVRSGIPGNIVVLLNRLPRC